MNYRAYVFVKMGEKAYMPAVETENEARTLLLLNLHAYAYHFHGKTTGGAVERRDENGRWILC